MSKLERRTRIVNAHGSVGLSWYVAGDRGAVEFHATLEVSLVPCEKSLAQLSRFTPGGVELHSKAPLYNADDEPHSRNCLATGGACWKDGSSLVGFKLTHRHVIGAFDEEALWGYLEDRYHEAFSKEVPQ